MPLDSKSFWSFGSACCLFLGILAGGPTGNAAAFVRFGNLEGSSADQSHQAWSDFESSSLFLYHVKGTPRPQLARLQLSKRCDAVSPALAKASAAGTTFGTLKLDFTRNLNSTKAYFQLVLEDARIFSLTVSVIGGTAREVMDVEFSKMSWLFTTVSSTGGAGEQTGAYWDLTDNSGGEIPSDRFQVNGVSLRSGGFHLAWPAKEGQRFRVLGSVRVEGPYRVIREVVADKTGGPEIDLPASEPSFFFNVERLQ